MKKLTLGLATAGTLAAMTIGLASPAMASAPYAGTGHDAVYVTDGQTQAYQPVDCSVHVNHQGTDVNVNWC
jgi:hypothetical protein